MKSWVKVYTEINHDPKMGTLTWAQRGIWMALLALAGEIDDRDDNENETGVLDTFDNVAWRIRCDTDELTDAIAQFTTRGMVADRDGVLHLVHYSERQARPPSSKPSRVAARVRRHRAAQVEDDNEDSVAGNDDVTPFQRGVTPSDSDSDSDSDSETEIPTSSVADATPVKPDTKPDKKPKSTTRTTKPKKPLTESQQMFTALAAICAIDLRTLTEGQRGQLNQSEKILRDAGATPEQMPGFRAWWDRDDWRGKKGEPPEPYQVRAEWGRYLESLKAARSPASVAVRVYT